MKLTKETLKQIIKEELSAFLEEAEEVEFGRASVSTSDRAKDLRAKSSETDSQKQVDNLERGIIKQFTDRLQKLAQLSNIKSGNINSVLKRVYAIMDAEIQKIEGGENEK